MTMTSATSSRIPIGRGVASARSNVALGEVITPMAR